MDVLRLKVAAPETWFKIPVNACKPEITYPIPPYSTVIGLLCNVLGKQSDIDEFTKSKPYGISICGGCLFTTQEYVWLRNMDRDAHNKRFFMPEKRLHNGIVEHPGGVSPFSISTLNEFEACIYITHPNKTLLYKIRDNIDRPERWLSHLHLGPSEAWSYFIQEDCEFVELEETSSIYAAQENDSQIEYKYWLPDTKYYFMEKRLEEYEKVFKRINGLTMLIASSYRKAIFDNRQMRYFNQIPVKLCYGQIPYLGHWKRASLFFDTEKKVPVFMARIDPV